MHRPNEQDLAWDLIDHCRQCLSVAELNTVFLQLGNGQSADSSPSADNQSE
jgi:hypothetical protein